MFPNIVFVIEEKETDGTKYLSVYKTPQDAMQDDGPTLVGTYKLGGKRKLIKNIHEVKPWRHRKK